MRELITNGSDARIEITRPTQTIFPLAAATVFLLEK